MDNIIQADQLPSPEIAVFPRAESYHIGGAAANTAVWLARMGVPVGLSGNVIGNDLYGTQLQAWLGQHERLDLAALEIVPGTTTPFTRAIVTPDGRTLLPDLLLPANPQEFV